MLRYKIYNTEIVDNYSELDFLSNMMSINYSGNTVPFTVGSVHVGRPDIISFQVYGDDRFWWLLLKYNNVSDVWNDLKPGMILRCPPKNILEKYYMEAVKKRK